ncbi:hypothetical protein AYK26_00680 [Euryarchaeota archaeon SM23-78]|nr:MAG: hypothetical protein AYK26_00680 [Euryarchaeota archaeon SM23-78]
MNKKILGPILIFAIVAIVAVAIKFISPIVFKKKQISTSRAQDTELIKWAGDSYLGYWFLKSPDMRIYAPRNGIELSFHDDGGAYAERLEKFNDGEYDFIVLPVAEYLKHGFRHKYPGVIVASISESKGADAMVAFADVLPTGRINDLNNPALRFVYTSESPSSFLIDLTIADFDFDRLQADNSWRSEVGSSEEAYERAKKAQKDRSIGDVFVMWEPEVSRAVDKLGMKVIWGSDKFAGYIIDVFVFHRDFVQRKPAILQKFLNTYFMVLDRYATDKERMIKEMSRTADLNEDVVETMLKKIDWYDLQENCALQFGIQISGVSAPDMGIVKTIVACSDVMIRSNQEPKQGDFTADSLRDPYLIVNDSFLSQLASSSVRAVGAGAISTVVDFEPLDDAGWANLREIGTMRIEPITFQQGTNRLDDQGKDVVDRVAQMLVTNYPNYRVIVGGHTGPGDEEANKKLSTERAQVVAQRLIAVHGIDPDRLRPNGYGATRQPQRKPDESTRLWRLRMSRVEFVLLAGSTL